MILRMDWWQVGLIFFFLIGACIGSFLNVVIYRVPRGLRVNSPPRSYCPHCEVRLPWYRNIPIVTWIIQRGKCASCSHPIAKRYLAVELLTALLWTLVWGMYPGPQAGFGVVLVSLLIAISFIDAEHFVIPVYWCWIGALAAVGGAFFFPTLAQLDGTVHFSAWSLTEGYLIDAEGNIVQKWPLNLTMPLGFLAPLLGWVIGYSLLIAVVLLGKAAFGRKTVVLEQPEEWSLVEPSSDHEELTFQCGDEIMGWSELFHRKGDALIIEGGAFELDKQKVETKSLIIRKEEIECGGVLYPIKELSSARGRATQFIIPREAMGEGDPPFLALIGAFLGAPAVLFTLFCASFYALGAAVLGRVGFGRPLPFGPFLALGAFSWLFGGWKLWVSYLQLAGF